MFFHMSFRMSFTCFFACLSAYLSHVFCMACLFTCLSHVFRMSFACLFACLSHVFFTLRHYLLRSCSAIYKYNKRCGSVKPFAPGTFLKGLKAQSLLTPFPSKAKSPLHHSRRTEFKFTAGRMIVKGFSYFFFMLYAHGDEHSSQTYMSF